MNQGVRLAGLGPGVLQDPLGNVIAARGVYVLKRDAASTTAPNQVQVYSDEALTTPVSQPLLSDANGVLPGYVAPGQSVDLYDSVTTTRMQAEALLASAVATRSWLAVNVMDSQYGAKGDGVTDDTAAVQAALNAAGAKAAAANVPVEVWLPAGYQFYVGQLTLPTGGGVGIRAYGAQILPNLNNWPTIWAMFDWIGTGILPNFSIRGGTWTGSGAETNSQGIFQSRSNRGVQDIALADMKVTGWGVQAFYVRNPTRARALYNTIINPAGITPTGNDLNFVFDGSATANGELQVIGNTVEGSNAASIAAVVTSTFAGAIKAEILANITGGKAASTASSNNSGAISFEIDAALADTDVTIGFNNINATNTNAGAYALLIGSGAVNATPGKVLVLGNTVKSAKNGVAIGLTAPETTVALNRFDIAGTLFPNSAPTQQFGNRLSSGGGASQGRATLVAGTVTVSTGEIQANDNVLLGVVAPGGTRGEVQLGTITAGTSFVINSIQPGTASTLQAADTSTVFWQIVH